MQSDNILEISNKKTPSSQIESFLKDEEFQKKLQDNSHLPEEKPFLDSIYLTSKEINCSISQDWNTTTYPKFLAKISAECKKNYPIDNFKNNQNADNIIYQHPILINSDIENKIKIANSFREIETDLMNKYFENSEYFDYYISLYNQELFLNEERRVNSINEFKEKIKTELQNEIKTISNDQQLKLNLVLIKILLKELSNISLNNLNEQLMNSMNLENYSKFIESHFKISYLLINEIKDIIKKINTLTDLVISQKNFVALQKILLFEYNIMFGLKNLFGILTFLKNLENLDKKNLISNEIKNFLINNIRIPTNIEKKFSNIIKINSNSSDEKDNKKSFLKINNDELNLDDSSTVFLNYDLIYILNKNNDLIKLHRLNTTKNKYNLIKINKNISKENISIFSYNKEFLFSFDNSKFGKSNDIINLISKEHSTDNSKTKIILDENSEKIMTKSLSENNKEIINEIYDKLFKFEDEKDKEQFYNNYKLINNITIENNISITQDKNYLYILHPIYQNNNNKEDKSQIYYFSNKYIYVLDKFELSSSNDKINKNDENIIYINYIKSILLKAENKDDIKNKINIDTILSNIKTKNKFLILNNCLCFNDTCKMFYNLKEELFIFDNNEKYNITQNDLNKDIVNETKENIKNSIIMKYNNRLLFIILISTENKQFKEIKENIYDINDNNDIYNSNNIFIKNKQMYNLIGKNLNKEESSNNNNLINNNLDIFGEVFQTFEEIDNNNDIYNNNSINQINENLTDLSISNYILSYLCKLIIENNELKEINDIQQKNKNKQKDNLIEYTKYLKRPHTINIDHPTIKYIQDLLELNFNTVDNLNNQFNIYCLLLILNSHLNYLLALRLNALFVFGNEENITSLINLLLKISKNKDNEIMASSIIIKILSITENYNKTKVDKIFNELLFPIKFMQEPKKLQCYLELFNYSNYSKENSLNLININSGYKFILELTKELISNEKDIDISTINYFFNEFLSFYNNLLSFIFLNTNEKQMSQLINDLLLLIRDNITIDKILNPKILSPLLHSLIVYCLINNEILPNYFYLQNWSFLYDILEIIQNLRFSNENNINFQQKKDFILDTFNFSAEFPGNKAKDFIFGNKDEKSNNKEDGDINTSSDKKNESIFIEILCIMKNENHYNKKSNSKSILEITKNNSEDLLSLENDLYFNKVRLIYKEINDINLLNSNIKIRLYPQSLNYLIKVRIANYKFYDEKFDTLLNPITELFNKMLNKLAFYYTNKENEMFNLFNTRLFSHGYSNNKLIIHKEDHEDSEIFLTFLQKNNKNSLNKLIINNLPDKDKISNEKEDITHQTITEYNSANCKKYLENNNIIKCINYYKEKQNIFIKGEIPDKIVNISFLTILKHENLLISFMDYCKKTFDDNKNDILITADNVYYQIYSKCNDLRKTYKEKKDSIIKQEKLEQLDSIFNEIYDRLFFLFNLNSEKINNSNNNSNTNINTDYYLKEHVNNIAQIILNEKLSLNKIIDSYQIMQSQAKFREISLIILNYIINNFKDKHTTQKIIDNYYKIYCISSLNNNNNNYDDNIKLPNIYESLNTVSVGLVANITNNFSNAIIAILNKLISDKNNSFFDLSIYLNFLLWKIKRRNYPTIIKIFEIFDNNLPKIEESMSFLFNSENFKGEKEVEYSLFKEGREMNKFTIAKILSNIFIYYYQGCIIREINEKKISYNENENKGEHFKLSKTNSIISNNIFDNILIKILSIFEKQSGDILNSYISSNEKNNDKDKNLLLKNNENKIYNKKLTNLLNEFIKLVYSDFEIIYSENNLWLNLYGLLKYTNYQNTSLIFYLLKKFTLNSFELFSSTFSNIIKNYSNENYYEYLLNLITNNNNNNKSLYCDYLNYIYINKIDTTDLLSFIEKKIKNDKQIFLLEVFGYKIQTLNHLTKVIVNTNLNLENKPLTYKPTEKELAHLIKTGYYFDKFQEKTIADILLEKKAKEQNDLILQNLDEEDNDSNYEGSSSNEGTESNEDSSDSSSRSGSSGDNDDDNNLQDNFEIRDLNELLKKQEIVREIQILSEKIYGNTPNFININENELCVEDQYLKFLDENKENKLNDDLINCVIDYIKEELILKNNFSPKLFMEYISIFKCLIVNSDNKIVQDFLKQNIDFLIKVTQILTDPKQNNIFQTTDIIFLKNKIESSLGGLFKLLPNLTQESKLLITDINQNLISKNSKEIKIQKNISKFYGIIEVSDDLDFFSVYCDPTKKVDMPIINQTLLSGMNLLKDDYSFKKIPIEILNKNVYNELLDKYKIMGKIREGGVKIPEINEKYIIITEDLLKEIGISDYEYVNEKETTIRKARKMKGNKKEDEKNENDEEDKENKKDKEKEEDKKENKEEDKNKVEDKENKEEKEEDKKEEKEEETIEDKKENKEEEKKEEEKKEEIKSNKDEKEEKKEDKKEDEKKSDENNNTEDNGKNNNLKNSKNNTSNNNSMLKESKKLQLKFKEPEIYRSEKWNEFYDLIEFKYQLGNCIFIIDSKYFYKFPKKFCCMGIDASEFSTENLTEETLYSKIIDHNKNIKNEIPDEVISNLLSENKKTDVDTDNAEENNKVQNSKNKNKLFENICNKFKIKIKEHEEKLNDRNLSLPKTFFDLYENSPKLFGLINNFNSIYKNNENGFLNNEEYNRIKYLSVYLLKYYITLLLIKEKQFDHFTIRDFKFMFYITSYYKNYFGLEKEHKIVFEGLYSFLEFILKKSENKINANELISDLLNSNTDVYNLETFIHNTNNLNTMIQDDFLILIIEYLINNEMQNEIKEDERLEKNIISCLLQGLKKNYTDNKLEKCIIFYKLIYNTLQLINEKIDDENKKRLLLNIFKEQKIIKTLLEVMKNSKNKIQRTDFSIYTIEFLLNILTCFTSKNIYLSKNESEQIENVKELVQLCDDYDTIKKKLNSKYIISKLISEDEDWSKLITLKFNLPNVKPSKTIPNFSYSIQFINEIADNYELSLKNSENENENKKYLTAFLDLNKNQKEKEKEDKKKKNNNNKTILTLINSNNKYYTTSNELLIYHESEKFLKNTVVGNIKNFEEELKDEIINIKKIYRFNSRTSIIIDVNNKFHSIGEWYNDFTSDDFCEIKQRPELDKLDNEDKIINININCILTKNAIYFSKENSPRSLPNIEDLPDGKLTKYVLPELKNDEKFIKAMYLNSLVFLTNKKNIYGIVYKGDYQLLSSTNVSDKYALIKIKTPEFLNIIDVVYHYDCVIYLGYDQQKKTNIVYGNLNTENARFFSRRINQNLSRYVFMKEIFFFTDKNITDLYLNENIFIAFSRSEGKIYYFSFNSSDNYGIKTLKYFINLNIQIKSVLQVYNGFFFIPKNDNDINEKTNNNDNNNEVESFYRNNEDYDINKVIFFAGRGEIGKLIRNCASEYMDRVSLKKPKLIDLESQKIKSEFLKKKNDITIKAKNILYNGSRYYICFEYYQSFINPKKIIEENNYILKDKNKIEFGIIFTNQKESIYFIELKSLFNKTIKENDYENYIFEITKKQIETLPNNQKEKYENIILNNFTNEKIEYIIIQELYNEEENLYFNEEDIIKNQILKEELAEFIPQISYIKKIALELPNPLEYENNTSNFDEISNTFKNKIIIENNIDMKKYFIKKTNDTILELKMEINQKNIEKYYSNEYNNIKKKVIESLSSINEDYLLEFQKTYPSYLKEIEENKLNKNNEKPKTLQEYMKSKYEIYDRFIKFSEEPKVIEIISNLVSQITKSAENLLNHSLILYNTSLTQILFNNVNFLSEKSRSKNFNSNILLLKHSKYKPEIVIDRMLNLKNCNLNLVDKDLEWSLIAQMYKSILSKEKGTSFFKANSKNLFQVILEGEHASDAGGPGREIFSSAFEQLTSSYVELFIPSPNNKSQTGMDRDKYIFNPYGAKNEKYIDFYKFIGKLFGYIISSETYVSLNLSSVVYKQILGMSLDAADIELIDVQNYKAIIKVLSSNSETQKKKLYDVINFTCQLPGGEIVELKEKGSNIYLNENNCEEFLELYLKTFTNQGYAQAKAIQKGLFEVIPEYMIKFLTPADLEKKICGEPFFDLDLLRTTTVYNGYKPADITIKLFWQFLSECSLEDKCNYIKFVWGRSRLPKNSKGFGEDPHKITKSNDKNALPISHTCFFEIELPPYENYNVLKEKLLYAMKNSVIISDNDEFLDIEV